MDFKGLTDEQLMLAYQSGDERAFAELYARYSGKVYGYLMSQLRNRTLADDVFQGVFLKLHAVRAQYDPKFAFVSWLFTICRSVMIDAIRRGKRVLEESDTAYVESAIPENRGPGAAEAALPNMKVLSKSQLNAVQLRYAEELSFEEIARRLETSPANVRQIISRAIRRLRALKG